MNATLRRRPSSLRGFTLIEIMIVVIIIGLLASMAISSFIYSRRQTIALRVANDLRIFGDAFNTYVMEEGVWPADGQPGETPDGMGEYLPEGWSEGTSAGGMFDWDQDVFDIVAAVSVDSPTVENEVLERIDEILDDGNLSSGRVRARSGGIMLVLEE